MAAINEYYVDPVSGDDTDTGGSGDPWKTCQHALDTITRDTSDGDRINVKASGDETLSSALNDTTYGNPTATAPLIFQGYTSTQGDGGIGGLSGGGSVSIFNDATQDATIFYDMHLHNSGSADIINLDNFCGLVNCEVDNTTGDGIDIDTDSLILDCHIHNIGSQGIDTGGGLNGILLFNFLKNETNDFSNAIRAGSVATVYGNVISIDGSSNGIQTSQQGSVIGNTIFSDGGTGNGILNSGNDQRAIFNNIIEGFSGSGGDGVVLTSGRVLTVYGHNKFYNNATNETLADVSLNLGNNTDLAASVFTDPGSDDFTIDDTSTVKGDGFPASYKGASTTQSLDAGAAQRVEAAAAAAKLVSGGLVS